jgi:hypothetical protein
LDERFELFCNGVVSQHKFALVRNFLVKSASLDLRDLSLQGDLRAPKFRTASKEFVSRQNPLPSATSSLGAYRPRQIAASANGCVTPLCVVAASWLKR